MSAKNLKIGRICIRNSDFCSLVNDNKTFFCLGWNSFWTKSFINHPNLWAVLLAFVEKESWAVAVYAQSSNIVGDQGCTGAAVSGCKTTGYQKCQSVTVTPALSLTFTAI
jgi:hypothetical protein